MTSERFAGWGGGRRRIRSESARPPPQPTHRLRFAEPRRFSLSRYGFISYYIKKLGSSVPFIISTSSGIFGRDPLTHEFKEVISGERFVVMEVMKMRSGDLNAIAADPRFHVWESGDLSIIAADPRFHQKDGGRREICFTSAMPQAKKL